MTLDTETLYENDMTYQDNSTANDDDDQNDDSDYNDSSDNDDPSTAIENASDDEVDAHRNMLGEVIQNLADNGVDVDELAEKAGIESADVDALSHDDLATLTQYVAQNHSDLVQNVSDRFPAAQGLLGAITGGGGGLLGKLFG